MQKCTPELEWKLMMLQQYTNRIILAGKCMHPTHVKELLPRMLHKSMLEE